MTTFGAPFVPPPELVSPPVGGVIGGDVALVAATDTLVQTSASLAAGVWAITWDSELVVTGAAASDAMVYVQAGTAAVTFAGPVAADGELPALAGGSLSLGFDTIATITTAGTLQFRAYSTLAATVKAASTVNGGKAVTGYTAVRIS